VELNETFDTVAELYDRARPSYPDELVDDLVAAVPGTSVLEIAPGTGKLTRQLTERRIEVHGVEMGENLAALARRFAPVTIARFEEWEPDREYDAVVCAAAWHWLDPEVAPVKAHAALRPGGVLAVVGGHHVFPPDADPFFREIQRAYDAIGEGVDELPGPDDIRHDYLRSLEASGLFDIETRGYLRVVEYDAESYIDVLKTYSGHIAMSEEQRATIFDEVRRLAPPGRVIGKHYLFCLHLARKAA
jgi:SAM-dependent methyltransferase